MNYISKEIKSIIFCLLKPSSLAMVFLLAMMLQSKQGEAQVWVTTSHGDIGYEFESATSVPSQIPRDSQKRLIYLRSEKKNYTCFTKGFDYFIQIDTFYYGIDTYQTVNKDYYVLVDSNQIVNFKYTYSWWDHHEDEYHYEDDAEVIYESSWGVGIISSKSNFTYPTCEGSTDRGSLSNHLYYGIAPEGPTKMEIKLKNKTSWVGSTMATEGDEIQLSLEGGGPKYVYEFNYNWNNVDSLQDLNESEWETIEEDIGNSLVFPIYEGFVENGNKSVLWLRAYTKENDDPVIGKSFGYVYGDIKVYKKPQFEISDTTYCSTQPGVNSIKLKNVQFTEGLDCINFTMKKVGDSNSYNWNLRVKETGSHDWTSPPDANVKYLSSGEYEITAENEWHNELNDSFAAGHVVKTFKITKHGSLSSLLIDDTTRTCSENKIIDILKDPESFPLYNLEYAYSSLGAFQPVINGKVPIFHNTDSLILRISSKDYGCPEVKIVKVSSIYPYFTFSPSHTQSCPDQPTYIKPNISQADWDLISEDLRAIMYFSVDDLKGFTHVSGSIPVTTDGEKVVTVGFLVGGKLVCPKYKAYEFTKLPLINFDLGSTPVIGCNSALNGSIIISNIKNVVATVEQPCKIKLSRLGASTFSDSIILTSIPNINSNPFSNLAAGKYVVKLIDGNGCTKTATITLSLNDTPFSVTDSIKQPSPCFYSNNGSVKLKASGSGADTYEVSKDGTNWQTNNTLENFSGGDYTVYARPMFKGVGIDECKLTDSIEFTAPDSVVIKAKVTQPTCSNDMGSVELSGAITYQMQTKLGWQAISNPISLYPGTYLFKGIDSVGCYSNDTSIIVDSIPQIKITNFTQVNPSCFGGDGSISFKIAQQLPVGQYNIVLNDEIIRNCKDGGDFASDEKNCYALRNGVYTIGNLPAGKYILEITQGTECSDSTSITITQPNKLQITFDGLSQNAGPDIACAGGKVNFSATFSGGTPFNGGIYNYSYIKNSEDIVYGDGSSIVFTKVTAKTQFLFTAIDSNGCNVGSTRDITEPDSLKLLLTDSTFASCPNIDDGSVTFEVFGGVLPYTILYKKDDQNEYQKNVDSPGEVIITGLVNTNWFFKVVDSNGCENPLGSGQYLDVDLVNPDEMGISTDFSNPTCVSKNDGDITVTAIGRAGLPKVFELWNGETKLDSFATNLDEYKFDSLIAGNYNVKFRFEEVCFKESAVSLTQPDSLTYTISAINNSCFESNNGSVIVNVSGGTFPYKVILFKGEAIIDSVTLEDLDWFEFDSLSPGNYHIELSDKNSCDVLTETTEVTVSNPEAPINLSLSQTPVVCYETATGKITAKASGGWGSYKYSIDNGVNWIDDAAEHVFSGLAAGNFSILLKDLMNCTISQTIEVTQPDVLAIANAIADSVSCFGGSDGSVYLTAMGGNGGYTWSFSNLTEDLPDSTIHNLASNLYFYSVKDVKGCTASGSIFVPQPDAFSIAFFTNSYDGYNIKCNGGTDSLWYSVAGGNTPYNMILNSQTAGIANEGETYCFPNLTAGSYTLSLVDRKQCPFEESIALIEPNGLIISTVTYTQPLCHNDSNGKIEVSATEGISPYMYNLEFDAATSWQNDYGKFTDLSSGEYQLSVTDKYGCTIDSVLTLNQPEPVSVNLVKVIPVTCKGGNDGYAEIEGLGGVGNFSYAWYNSSGNNVSSLNSIFGASADNYRVNVWDSNECNIAEQFPILIPEPANYLAIDTIELTQPSCFGESNGEIFIAATGGWGEFTYKVGVISNPVGNFIGLQAGSYDLIVIDSHNCSIDTTVILLQPELLEISLDSLVNVTCNGDNSGTIYVSSKGGNGGNEYNINEINNATGEFNDLAAASYTVLVKDSLGCNANITATITQPSAITYASAEIVRPTCQNANGAITINSPSGGTGSISITWKSEMVTDTGFVVDSLPAGNYEFILTDETNCSKDFTITLSDIDGPKIDSITITNPTCSYRSDGSIKLTLSGDAVPFNVTWTGNGTWESDSSTYINILGGNYSVQVVDSNNCKTLSDFIVKAPDPVSVSVEVVPISCFGDSNGELTATISGGTAPYSHGWYVNGTFLGFFVDSLPANSYSLSVKDLNGCGFGNSDNPAAGSYNVLQPEYPLQFTEQLSQPDCYGNHTGAISINTQGGWGQYKYSLNGGEAQSKPVFSNLSTGEHCISVSDVGGCSVLKTVMLGQPDELNLQLVSTDSVKCFGESNGQIKVNAIGGTTAYTFYTLANPSNLNSHGNFYNLPSANYKLYVNDKNNCSDSLDVFVSQPDTLQVSISNIFPAHCGTSDGEIQLTAQGGNGSYKAVWNGYPNVSLLILSSIPSGNYSATVIDAKGCQSNVENATVPVIAGPTLMIDDIVSPLCSYSFDGSIQFSTLNGSAPFAYYANNQSFENEKVDNISGGIYHLKVIDNFGCFDTVTVEVVAPQELTINVIEETSPRCHNFSDGKISISSAGGTLPHGYSWSNSQNGSTISSLSYGSYTVTLTDNHNCTKQENYVLRNPAPIVVNLPQLVTLCAGQTSQIDANNEGSMFWWTSTSGFESFERQIEVSETGSYYLQITNPAGCFAYDTVNVTKHNYEVDATFIIPSEAYVGDTIVAIDISWPIPDSLYWVIPSEFEIVESYQYEYILKPKQEGNYSIGIVSYVGECSAYQQKSIIVLPQQAAPLLPKEGLTDIFVSASVAPNPASNSTLLSVELSRIANLSISVHNAFGQKVKALSVLNGNSYRITIPVAAFTKGVYMIVLTAETSTRTIKLVVN